MGFRETLKNLLQPVAKKAEKEFENTINQAKKEVIARPEIEVLKNAIDEAIALKNIKADLSSDRLKRYLDYEYIIKYIPEAQRALNVYSDLVLRPEFYTKNIFEITSSITQLTDNDSDLIEVLKDIVSNDINLEKKMKKIEFNTLLYGDYFVRLKRRKDGTYFLDLINPKRVIKLELNDKNYGYLVSNPVAIEFLSRDDRYVVNILSNIIKNVNVDTFKEVVEETAKITSNIQESDIFGAIEELMGEPVDPIIKNVNDISLEMLENITPSKLEEIQEVVYENMTNIAYMNTPGNLTVDLTHYMNNTIHSSLTGFDEDFYKLMGIEEYDYKKGVELTYVPPQEMIHFKLTNNSMYEPYGSSIFETVRSVASLIILLEYSLVIYRLMKSPERFKYIIDVTGIDKAKVDEYVNHIKKNLKSDDSMNISEGNIVEKLNFATMLEDYFIIERDGKRLLDVERMEGGHLNDQIDDIKYWHAKLLSGLGLPPSFLSMQEDGLQGTATVLVVQDARVARSILRIQDDLMESVEELLDKYLNIYTSSSDKHPIYDNITLGRLRKYLKENKIRIDMAKPHTIEAKAKIENTDFIMGFLFRLKEQGFDIDDLISEYGIVEGELFAENLQSLPYRLQKAQDILNRIGGALETLKIDPKKLIIESGILTEDELEMLQLDEDEEANIEGGEGLGEEPGGMLGGAESPFGGSEAGGAMPTPDLSEMSGFGKTNVPAPEGGLEEATNNLNNPENIPTNTQPEQTGENT